MIIIIISKSKILRDNNESKNANSKLKHNLYVRGKNPRAVSLYKHFCIYLWGPLKYFSLIKVLKWQRTYI